MRVSAPVLPWDLLGLHIHPGVAGGGAVDVGLVDDEEDLSKAVCQSPDISQHFF